MRVQIRSKYSATVAFSWQEDKDGKNKYFCSNRLVWSAEKNLEQTDLKVFKVVVIPRYNQTRMNYFKCVNIILSQIEIKNI